VKRTAEKVFGNHIFQSSASRTLLQIARPPSAEALGYFHSVRFADVENDLCSKAAPGLALHKNSHSCSGNSCFVNRTASIPPVNESTKITRKLHERTRTN
jgi:hypothetical protein